jgi:hypothetical protein
MVSESASSAPPAGASSSMRPPPSKGGVVSTKTTSSDSEKHDIIEGRLRSLLSSLRKREPLDPSYDYLVPASYRKHVKASVTVAKTSPKSQSSSSSSAVEAAGGGVGGGGGDDLGGGRGGSGRHPPAGKRTSGAAAAAPAPTPAPPPAVASSAADVKLRRRLNADLREIVETYASTPAGWRRRPNARMIDVDFGGGGGVGQANDGGGGARAAAPSDGIDVRLRAAFALRESKEHEQRDLVNATLKAESLRVRRGWGLSQVAGGSAPPATTMGGALPPLEEASARKRRLEGIARQLRDRERGAADRARWTKIAREGRNLILNPESALRMIVAAEHRPGTSAACRPGILAGAAATANASANPDQVAKRQRTTTDPEQERQQQIEEAKHRERILRERLERGEAENKRLIEKEREEQERRERALETPRDALHRLYEPIFVSLWDMEFAALGNTNPFRMVIDASTCADMGVPDYCSVIKKPMNLTFVQTKVNNKSYETLQEFLEDVDLIAKNALQYNHDPSNPYHIAAKGFRKKFRKLAKPLIESLTKGMSTK